MTNIIFLLYICREYTGNNMETNHKHVTCSNCASKKDSLFNCFDNEQTEDLNDHKTCNYYKKSQALFLEGSARQISLASS